MAHQAQDDGFHEIQLNGKQLVFVFMAATLLSVVIFLCGVLVGRGVQRERVVLAQTDVRSAQPPQDANLDPAKPNVPPTAPVGADPTKVPQSVSGDRRPPSASAVPTGAAIPTATPNAARRGEAPVVSKPEPPAVVAEAAKPRTSVPAGRLSEPEPIKASNPPPVTRTAEAESVPKPTATTGNGPQTGWVVQVASVDARNEADSIAKRLTDKGYQTFVLESGPNRFRVRVGGFKSRGDADAAAAQLRKEERIEPWVTR